MNTTPENNYVTNPKEDVEEFKNQLFEEDLEEALKEEIEKYAPVEEASIVGGESDNDEIPPDTETPPSSVPQSSSQGNEAPYNHAAERIIENLNADQTPLTLVPNDIPSNRGEDVVRDGYGNRLSPQPDAWGGHKPK